MMENLNGEFERKVIEERKKKNDELVIRLADAPKLRDINVCKKCQSFWKHDDGFCGCRNTHRNHGRPWCRETMFGVTEEVFEKVHVFIWDKERCPFEKCENQGE